MERHPHEPVALQHPSQYDHDPITELVKFLGASINRCSLPENRVEDRPSEPERYGPLRNPHGYISALHDLARVRQDQDGADDPEAEAGDPAQDRAGPQREDIAPRLQSKHGDAKPLGNLANLCAILLFELLHVGV